MLKHWTGIAKRRSRSDFLMRLMIDESGASASEYALILAVVGAAIALAAVALGGSITNSMQRSDNTITTCGGGC